MNLDIDSLAELAQTYLSFHLGEVRFGPIDTCILVLALSVALVSAVNLWRIGTREDRQQRLDALIGAPLRRTDTTATPAQSWYHRLGTGIGATPIVGTAEQHTLLAALAAAGIKGHGNLAALIAGKVCGGTAFGTLFWLFLEWQHFFAGSTTIQLGVLAAGFFLGWRAPEVVLSRLAARRKVRIEQGMPDALDLLVICAESGLSLDQAVEQVGIDLRLSSPDVADEFAETAAEMRVLPDRSLALENMARRTGIASLRSIVTTLTQAIKFGTPLAESLRVLAGEMRAARLARIEERAARLPVLLTIPLMSLILPVLMIVIGTPLALRMIDVLGSMVGGPAALPR
jgi:tight adherence protein C